MRTCERCQVDVYGSGPACPLCQTQLPGTQCMEEDIFPIPVFDAQAARRKRFLAAFAAGSAGVAVICVALNIMVSTSYWWSPFVLGGIATFWIIWFLTESKKKTISRSIVWETVVIALLAVLWDVFTGFKGWSVNYVVPILMAFGTTAMPILTGIGVTTSDSSVFYRFVLSVLGLVPAILLLTRTTSLFVPSVICAALSALSLIHIFGFEMVKLVPELKRRLHI